MTSPGTGTSFLKAVRTCTEVMAAFAPPATAMTFSPSSSTTITATPVDSSGRVSNPSTSIPSATRAVRASAPNVSPPTAPTMNVRAPRRAAATAWLPPLPP
jgi:hypothetical protein